MHIVVMVVDRLMYIVYHNNVCRPSAVEMGNFHQVVGSALELCNVFFVLFHLLLYNTQNYIDSVGSHGCVGVLCIYICIFETAGG